MWKDAEFHARLWTDPALRDVYVKVIDETLIDAITGNEPMEKVADALSEIVMTQVWGELQILGLWTHLNAVGPPIKYIVHGSVLARMVMMKQVAEAADDDPT